MSHLEITELLHQINEGHDDLWTALMEGRHQVVTRMITLAKFSTLPKL